jgi:pimeloyl-ACP methyl ester carboxylesterase
LTHAQATIIARNTCPESEFTCITVRAPLDHFGQSSETIAVVFGVLPARDPAKRRGMLVTAVGGPGASGLRAADAYAATLDDTIRNTFDLVFFDQRGIGLSGGFDCAEAAATYYRSDGRSRTPAQEHALVEAARRFVDDCLRSLPPPEHLQFYTTRQAVEDLELFRQTMGETRLWLYGESYGTQFAQWYAATHSDHVAGLILDGAVDLTLNGVQFARDTTRAFNDTLLATLKDCNAKSDCRHDARGDAIRAYDQLAARLDRAPVTFRFPLPDGAGVTRTLGLSDLETAAAGFLYTEGERMLLQRALAAASGGDYTLLARLFYASLGLDPVTLAPPPPSGYSDAAYYVFTCNDYRYFDGSPDARARAYLRAGDAIERAIPRMQSVFYGDLPCVFWPRHGTPARYDSTPARAIPTLILGATADPATPVEQSRAVARRLLRARLITTLGGAHVTFNRGDDCPDRLVKRFLIEGRLPAQMETRCDGVIAEDYAPIAPADARQFADAIAAMRSFESELLHLPEYYYWDGEVETTVGCTRGGAATFAPADAQEGAARFTFSGCAFSSGFVLSGAGLHDPERDRFTLDARVSGDRVGALRYTREGASGRVTGMLDGSAIDLRRE